MNAPTENEKKKAMETVVEILRLLENKGFSYQNAYKILDAAKVKLSDVVTIDATKVNEPMEWPRSVYL